MKRESQQTLRFEPLEQKRMLAGNVLVSVDEGILTIKGDDLDNQVVVTSGEGRGEYVIQGLDGTHVVLASEGDRSASPDSRVVVEGVRRGARIAMGAGDDLVVINKAHFRGNVMINTGEGADRVLVGVPRLQTDGPVAPAATEGDVAEEVPVRDRPSVSIGGSLAIRTGADGDVVRVGNARVRRNLAIGAGTGDDTVLLGAAATPRPATDAVDDAPDTNAREHEAPTLRVGGRIRTRLGAGADELAIADAHARRSISADGGQGEDAISLRNVQTRRLGIRGGRGDAGDQVTLAGVDAAFASIATGGGNDRVRIGGSSFRALVVRAGAGDDTVSIANTQARLAVLLGGMGEDTWNDLGENRFGHSIIRGFELPPTPSPDDLPAASEELQPALA